MDEARKNVYVVDDDPDAREFPCDAVDGGGLRNRIFDSATAFLRDNGAARRGCVVADVRMPDMDGLALQEELVRLSAQLCVVIVTGHADVPLAVRAMKAGAIDFLEKPFDEAHLLASVERAFAALRDAAGRKAVSSEALERIALLTEREKQVLRQIVDGHANKVIAYHLSISPRTVELHRARVMDKMEARSVAELVRMSLPVLEMERNSGNHN